MALLLDGERAFLRHKITELLSRDNEPFSLTKLEWRAAVDATDDWIDANAAGFNQALPPAARTGLTTRQKALLFMLVAGRRYEVI